MQRKRKKVRVNSESGEVAEVPQAIAHTKKGVPTPLHASRRRRLTRISESVGGGTHFFEQGIDEQTKPKTGKKKGKGRVYLVTIIEEGMGNSKDKNYYSKEALKAGPKLFNGSKAYADHPDAIQEKTLPERSMKDLVGWYSDCFVDQDPQAGRARLRGKLHFFPDAKWLTDKIDTILTDPSAKNLFGISINAIGKTRPATISGEVVNYVEQFQRVDSADVVTEPAARGKFDQMLESKRGRSRVAVSRSGMKRARESGVLNPDKAKKIADSLVSGYNSDSPDEMKEAMISASKELYAASSVSGKGPGQVNEEMYSNINPAGGKDMARPKLKASASGPVRTAKRKKHLRAAAGTGPDNEMLEEPSPKDTASQITEADVEDEEGEELGDFDDYGDKSKKVKASGKRRLTRAAAEAAEDEDEAFEDEGMEDEDEDEIGAMPAPASPGSSTSMMSAEAEEDEAEEDEDDLGDEEGLEDEEDGEDDEGMFEAEEEDDLEEEPAGGVAESGRRRRMRSKEASLSGSLGKSGKSALPSHAVGDYNEDYTRGSRDESTSGTGKSYKLKTSKFRKNKIAKKVAREANRRIAILESENSRLRESGRAKERKIVTYRGIIRHRNSVESARTILREAVKDEILPLGYARTLEPQLHGFNREEQIREVKRHARLLESTRDSVVSSLMENVEGAGARGFAVSWGSEEAGHSELVEALAAEGIPVKKAK